MAIEMPKFSASPGLVDEGVLVASGQPDGQRSDDRAEGHDQPAKVDRPAATAELRTAWSTALAPVPWFAPTAAATPNRPANAPTSRDLAPSVAGAAPSGPPASTTRKSPPMASPQPSPLRTRTGPAARCGRSARPTCRPSWPTSATTLRVRWLAPTWTASRGGAGAGHRGPARRLRTGDLAADAGRRMGRLDPDPALAGRRRPWHQRRCGSPWQPAGAPAGTGRCRAGCGGGRLGAAVPAQPRRQSPGGAGQRGSGAPPACSTRWSDMGGRSCMTWPSPVAGPTSTTW